MSDFLTNLTKIQGLNCKEYWESVAIDDWDITDYDKRIVNSKGISKRSSHLSFKYDLDILKSAFIDDDSVLKVLGKLATQLKSVQNNQANKKFWYDEYPQLKKQHKRKPEQVAESSTNKRVNVDTDMEENDGVMVDNEIRSVGTIIKAAAVKIHQDKFIKGVKLSTRERNVMSSGLSSILDLIDGTNASQKSLFNDEQWTQLVNRYTNLYKPLKSSLPSFVSNTLKIISATITYTADVSKGIKYINKILGEHDGDDVCFLEAIKTILTNMLDKPEYFIKTNPEDLKEADYLRVLWSPLFEALFKTENCIVKIKTGESVYKYTTTNRAEAYQESDNVIGFKIDIRFTMRIDKEHIDFGCGEVGVSDSNSKVLSDEGKLLREAKEAVDNLLYTCKAEYDHRCYAWTVQISGSSCFVGCLHLNANGLYIAVPQFSFSLPSTISELNNLPDIFAHLVRMKRDMHGSAMAVMKSKKDKHSVGFALGHGQSQPVNRRLEWVRDTWFTPPRNSVSKLPINLYMNTPRDLTDELLRTKYTDGNLPDDDADEFGWTQRGDQWFNCITKETLDKSPYGQ